MDESPIGRFVQALARYAALSGGAVMIGVTLVTVLSIIGRALIRFGFSPVPGDFEIVQAGMAYAIFVFLPWCHLVRGHAIVAILTDRFPVRFNALAEFVWDVVMFIVASFIAWRLWYGLVDKYAFHEQTFILRMPVWIGYALGFVGAVIFVIVALYCAVRSGRNALSRDPSRPASEVAE
jgi:TRAP-type C4-dicarboxylate transport system permease small subunit